jgi:hypothetical protein
MGRKSRRVRDDDEEDDEDFFYDRFGHRRRRRRRPEPPPPKPLWLRALGCFVLGFLIWIAVLILLGLYSLISLWREGFFDKGWQTWDK